MARGGALLVVLALAWVVPRAMAGRESASFYRGEPRVVAELAASVGRHVERGVAANAFHTGSRRYDGEWAFGSYQMAVAGLAQVLLSPAAQDRPARRAELRRAVEGLLDPSVRAFGTEAWGEDGLEHLEHGEGHAYLGYLNFSLGLARLADPELPLGPLHDRLSAALARRLESAPEGVVATYPGEAYPVDMCSIAGSLALHARTSTAGHLRAVERWLSVARARWIDRPSGYLVQAVDARTGEPSDAPRGSGTALAAYFLAYADRPLSLQLYRALSTQGRMRLAGFGAVREYPLGYSGRGDIDSGPVVLGAGLSATGFALAAARIHGDEDTYTALCRTAHLFGLKVRSEGRARYLAGGPLGDAILLATLTATLSAGAAR